LGKGIACRHIVYASIIAIDRLHAGEKRPAQLRMPFVVVSRGTTTATLQSRQSRIAFAIFDPPFSILEGSELFRPRGLC
jgi:hypothetical protein